MIDTTVSITSFQKMNFATKEDRDFRFELMIDGVVYKYAFETYEPLVKFRRLFEQSESFEFLNNGIDIAREETEAVCDAEGQIENVMRDIFKDIVEQKLQGLYEITMKNCK